MAIDTKTFEQTFKKNFVAITAYCNKYVSDIEDAKDITHRAFMTIWEKRDQLPEESNLTALAYRIVHNLAINHIRDNKKFCSSDTIPLTESDNTTADSDVQAAELQAAIADTIRHMPEKSRRVFLMSRYDNLSNNKIAEQLGCSIKTVEAHITTALKMLRKKIWGNEKKK